MHGERIKRKNKDDYLVFTRAVDQMSDVTGFCS
jgi:hypothetical protein